MTEIRRVRFSSNFIRRMRELRKRYRRVEDDVDVLVEELEKGTIVAKTEMDELPLDKVLYLITKAEEEFAEELSNDDKA